MQCVNDFAGGGWCEVLGSLPECFGFGFTAKGGDVILPNASGLEFAEQLRHLELIAAAVCYGVGCDVHARVYDVMALLSCSVMISAMSALSSSWIPQTGRAGKRALILSASNW